MNDWVVIVHKTRIIPLNFKEDISKPQTSIKNILTKEKDEFKRGVWDVYAKDLEIKIVVKDLNNKGYALITTITNDGNSYEKSICAT